MKIDTHKNFFGIRTEVNLKDKIILGVAPIILLLFLWYLLTSGSAKTIKLPVGTFEGTQIAPNEGTFFKDKIRLTLEEADVLYPEISEEDDNDENDLSPTLSYKNSQFSLIGLPVIKRGKNVVITLPPGKITGYSKPAAANESGKNESSDVKLFEYKYEVVETRVFAPVILPSPFEVFSSLPQLWSLRLLPKNILYSFLRVSAGFLTAFIVVFPIALLMGTFSKIKALFSPLVLFSGYLPIPALVPLTMCLFGTNETQKIMFLAIGFAIYLLPLFVKAIDDVDNVYLQTGYTLGANKYQTLNKILLPVAMPSIFDAMRMGFGVGWGYIILAEMVDMGSYGVGALILTSQRRGPREDIYLVLIAIVVMAFITDKIWEKCGERLFPYRSLKR
ncbi:MAG: ABC transporter permease [Candidatus Riflebacteria bacterium]|nr:ABC transporter permease [Candidatus Riflebacteria bacterium]MDD3376125.1 ABC transporter permease [Candidatus Riflebacteria bacterium]